MGNFRRLLSTQDDVKRYGAIELTEGCNDVIYCLYYPISQSIVSNETVSSAIFDICSLTGNIVTTKVVLEKLKSNNYEALYIDYTHSVTISSTAHSGGSSNVDVNLNLTGISLAGGINNYSVYAYYYQPYGNGNVASFNINYTAKQYVTEFYPVYVPVIAPLYVYKRANSTYVTANYTYQYIKLRSLTSGTYPIYYVPASA